MHQRTELPFVDEFRLVSPIHYLKTGWQTLFFFGECCKRGRHLYTTTAPSCCIPASYCHLSATLQTMSIVVVNLQDNRAVFRIFIALLIFSYDSPTYLLLFYSFILLYIFIRSYRIVCQQTRSFSVSKFDVRFVAWFGSVCHILLVPEYSDLTILTWCKWL